MCYKLECNFSSFSMEAFIPLIIDYWGHKMLCLFIAVDRSSIFSIQLRALMKMKIVGDIFTASFVGGRGGVNIALTLQISLRGWGKKKRMCTDWYAESWKKFFKSLCKYSCSSLVSVSCVPVSKPSLSLIYHQEGLIHSRWMNTLQMNSDSCIQFLSSSEKHRQWRNREINK